MNIWQKIIIIFVIILLIIIGIFWLVPYRELKKGQLAAIGYSNTLPSVATIYLFNPLSRTWRQLPTDNLFPHYIAWSPDGKEIAFTYSNKSSTDTPPTGIAILSLENMQTRSIYFSSTNEKLNVVTWQPDGQSIVFDVYESNTIKAIKKIDINTNKIETTFFPKIEQPNNFSINHIEITKNNDYIIGSADGIFISPANISKLFLVSSPGEIEGYFLTPDRMGITIPCEKSALCTYSIENDEMTKMYDGTLPGFGVLTSGNWSYDMNDAVYLLQGALGEPTYIALVDIQSRQSYIIYKFKKNYGPILWQIIWSSAK